MTEEFDDVMSFDASQLAINQPAEPANGSSNNFNSDIYKPRPKDAVSEDGIYRSTIKVVWNPFNLRRSVLEQQSYGLTDSKGFFSVVSSLTNNDKSCPIFKAWCKCRFARAKDGSFKTDMDRTLWLQQAKAEEGGLELFDKRYARWVLIQVLDDPNKPELNGRYMLWKLPSSIWKLIDAKQSPTNPAKAGVPVMDFLFGRSLDLEVTPGPGGPNDVRYTRETSYTAEISEDTVPCTNPDGSSLLTAEQEEILEKYVDAMKKNVWKEKDPDVRAQKKAAVDADPNTVALKGFYRGIVETIKTFAPNLEEILGYKPFTPEVAERVQAWIDTVLSGNNPKNAAAPVAEEPAKETTASPAPQPASTTIDVSDEDEDLPF